ncbi:MULTISPECIES: DUF3055 domain-containing protein [Bacillales]|jgi:hypothetical protein|uniref:DUF3055 domain-containing protein n=1 Tax=Brevibacillus aydinogluensis TaxID=927786 RepID=A0AA48M768_9BACL|nr:MULTISPECIES: DUF3055 domain-containing protein [Bacillales]REK61763.1 MAG: hypothetical protein DF221_15240 [Brevibacillus sp.]MBR8658062.1 DUF3055 domain-containing protein [Brevibacillus sp. NL20B1]MDT3414905.1 hypothetical protein [Brevibacillus aydinogluensis]NNV01596.1 DUF3055 domain-containing protein [Brevibacillus sp. MCWH]UFJ61245.1 DUF3055 domain-containing protein [Anoxybacillus sediminis]
MERFDHLYDVAETAQVRFFGVATELARHDFGIVFTNKFDGKPLVICMQTGQSTLLSSEDAVNPEYLKKVFRIDCQNEAEMLSQFFQECLPSVPLEDNQY